MRHIIFLLVGCICFHANSLQAFSSNSDTIEKAIDIEELNASVFHTTWNKFFDKSSSNSRYLQCCEKEGVNNINNAIKSYDKQRAKRIDIRAVGSCVNIDKKYCGSVRHYRSWQDFVRYISRSGNAQNITMASQIRPIRKASSYDQDITSPMYMVDLQVELYKHYQ